MTLPHAHPMQLGERACHCPLSSVSSGLPVPCRTSIFALLLACVLTGCGFAPNAPAPIETGFAFTNLSVDFYAQLALRPTQNGNESAYVLTPLLPPGATHRARFLDSLATACPAELDLRVWLYERINANTPIGLDSGELVHESPLAAAEVRGVPACGPIPSETYTIVTWDAPAGTGRLKIAQNSPVEELIRGRGLFPNPQAVWEFTGVEPLLAGMQPRPLPEYLPIQGRVILPDGSPVPTTGILLRTRFRLRLNDNDPANDPDAGFADPIALTTTAADGTFRFDRPAGAYRIEAFSDEFVFRPAIIDVEAPIDTLTVVAEPLP